MCVHYDLVFLRQQYERTVLNCIHHLYKFQGVQGAVYASVVASVFSLVLLLPATLILLAFRYVRFYLWTGLTKRPKSSRIKVKNTLYLKNVVSGEYTDCVVRSSVCPKAVCLTCLPHVVPIQLRGKYFIERLCFV